VNGDVWIGNLMVQCTSEDIDTLCSTTLSYATVTKLVNDFGTEIEANLIEGTFGCEIPASVIKGEAVSDLDLGAISTTNKHSQKEIDEAINDAKNTPVQDAKKQDKVDKEIAKAEEELDKAYQELANDKPDKAIDHSKKAWEHAQHAIKHAQK